MVIKRKITKYCLRHAIGLKVHLFSHIIKGHNIPDTTLTARINQKASTF